MAALRERLPADSVGLFGDRIHVVTDAPERTARRAEGLLGEAGFPVAGIRTVEPSLEDVFVSVLVQKEGSAA